MRLTLDENDMIIPKIQLKTAILSVGLKELPYQVNEFGTLLQ